MKTVEEIVVSDSKEVNVDMVAIKIVSDVEAGLVVELMAAIIVTDTGVACCCAEVSACCCVAVATCCCVVAAPCCCEEVASCCCGVEFGSCGDRLNIEVVTAGVNEDVMCAKVVEVKVKAKAAAEDEVTGEVEI